MALQGLATDGEVPPGRLHDGLHGVPPDRRRRRPGRGLRRTLVAPRAAFGPNRYGAPALVDIGAGSAGARLGLRGQCGILSAGGAGVRTGEAVRGTALVPCVHCRPKSYVADVSPGAQRDPRSCSGVGSNIAPDHGHKPAEPCLGAPPRAGCEGEAGAVAGPLAWRVARRDTWAGGLGICP